VGFRQVGCLPADWQIPMIEAFLDAPLQKSM